MTCYGKSMGRESLALAVCSWLLLEKSGEGDAGSSLVLQLCPLVQTILD